MRTTACLPAGVISSAPYALGSFVGQIATSFFVFQAQRDLAQARTLEILAIADYNKSLVDREAVQEVSLSGGGGGVTTAGSGALQTGGIVRQ